MAGWEESADRPVLAAPVLRPGDLFPPRPPDEEQSRRARWPIWAALVVVLALAAGAVVYVTWRTSTQSQAEQVAAVRKAYLAWWQARKQAYLKLDPAPLRPFTTDAGLRLQSSELAQLQQSKEPIKLVVPSHDMQIVVYQAGGYASVDDIWKSQDVSLDPTTHQPTSQPANDLGELSITFKFVGGKWLVDDQTDFGSSDAISGTSISYAVVAGGQPSAAVHSQLVAAFNTFRSARSAAYLKLKPDTLSAVEAQPYLALDQQHVSDLLSKNESVQYTQQDNYRIGMQDATHAWIYDTLLDRNQTLDRTTGKPTQAVQRKVIAQAYEMTEGAGGWLVSQVAGYSSS